MKPDENPDYKTGFIGIYNEVKSEIFMRYILSVKHKNNKVLHIGCGGKCNVSIPIKYSEIQRNSIENYDCSKKK